MRRRKSVCSPPASSRRGAIIIFGMMMLLVGSLLVAALIRTAGMTHRQLKREESRLQATLIAEAGGRRFLQKYLKSPTLSDDVWTVSDDLPENGRTATVRANVVTPAGNAGQKVVSILVEYPVGHPDLVRIRREIPLP